ncbi:MAG: efflux RND transporter periplasmic adaptor subunit [Candidatus Moranbacteria bacterium]|nr:efflux RND transporter periplasmic adaptor subunit [Candidatus Moranbacteria bacterium]
MKKTSMVAGLAIISALGYAGLWSAGVVGREEEKIEYKIEKVTRGDIQTAITVDGKVVFDTWKLDFTGAGTVDAIKVSLGEMVTKGQLLATLDAGAGESGLAQAKTEWEASIFSKERLADGGADYEIRKEAYKNAKDKLKAEDDLYDEYVDSEGKDSTQALAQKVKVRVAEADVEDAKNRLEQADADYKNADYQLEKSLAGYNQSKSEYDGYKITAPADGAIVARINGTVGSVFSNGQNTESDAFMTLMNEKVFWFEADVEDAEALKVSENMKAYLKFDSYPEYEFEGRVIFASPLAQLDSNGIATYKLIVSFDRKDIKLLSDMAGSAALVSNEVRDVLMVSNAAVKDKQGKQTVIVKTGDGFADKVVETGYTNGKKVEIKSGLNAGDEVVIVK